jgi:hypothetical protein
MVEMTKYKFVAKGWSQMAHIVIPVALMWIRRWWRNMLRQHAIAGEIDRGSNKFAYPMMKIWRRGIDDTTAPSQLRYLTPLVEE